MQLWDTQGQGILLPLSPPPPPPHSPGFVLESLTIPICLERFALLSRAFYRGSDGVMFVADLTSRGAVKSLDNWREDFIYHTVSGFILRPYTTFLNT